MNPSGLGLSTGAVVTLRDASFFQNEAKYRGGGHYQCNGLYNSLRAPRRIFILVHIDVNLIFAFCIDGAYTKHYRSRYIGNYAGSYGGGVSF